MDPLSATASIAGVATVAAQLSKQLFLYCEDVKGAETQIVEVANEVSLLSLVLEALQDMLDQKGSTCRPELERGARTISERCQRIFKDIETALGLQDGKDIKVTLRDRLTWFFKKERIKILQASLNSLKSTLNILLNLVDLAHSMAQPTVEDGDGSSGLSPAAQRQKRQLVFLVIDNMFLVGRLENIETACLMEQEEHSRFTQEDFMHQISPRLQPFDWRQHTDQRDLVHASAESLGLSSSDQEGRDRSEQSRLSFLRESRDNFRDTDRSGPKPDDWDSIHCLNYEPRTSEVIRSVIPHPIPTAQTAQGETMRPMEAGKTVVNMLMNYTYITPQVSESKGAEFLFQNDGGSTAEAEQRQPSPMEMRPSPVTITSTPSEGLPRPRTTNVQPFMPGSPPNPMVPQHQNLHDGSIHKPYPTLTDATATMYGHSDPTDPIKTSGSNSRYLPYEQTRVRFEDEEPRKSQAGLPHRSRSRSNVAKAAKSDRDEDYQDENRRKDRGSEISPGVVKLLEEYSGILSRRTNNEKKADERIRELEHELEIQRVKTRVRRETMDKVDAEYEKKDRSRRAAERSLPVTLKDPDGRSYILPLDACKSWKSMHSILASALSSFPNQHPASYDLIDPSGNFILPQVWDHVVQPGWTIELQLRTHSVHALPPSQPQILRTGLPSINGTSTSTTVTNLSPFQGPVILTPASSTSHQYPVAPLPDQVSSTSSGTPAAANAGLRGRPSSRRAFLSPAGQRQAPAVTATATGYPGRSSRLYPSKVGTWLGRRKPSSSFSFSGQSNGGSDATREVGNEIQIVRDEVPGGTKRGEDHSFGAGTTAQAQNYTTSPPPPPPPAVEDATG